MAEGSSRLGKGSVPRSERMPAKQALFHPVHCLRKLLRAAKGALPHAAQETWHCLEAILHAMAVWWAVSLSRLTHCASYSSSFLHHTVSLGACVSGFSSPGLQHRRDSKTLLTPVIEVLKREKYTSLLGLRLFSLQN